MTRQWAWAKFSTPNSTKRLFGTKTRSSSHSMIPSSPHCEKTRNSTSPKFWTFLRFFNACAKARHCNNSERSEKSLNIAWCIFPYPTEADAAISKCETKLFTRAIHDNTRLTILGSFNDRAYIERVCQAPHKFFVLVHELRNLLMIVL